MTDTMKSIFSRCLSTEIGKQEKWKNRDEDRGFNTSDRDKLVAEIRQFMQENNIEFRTDYYLDGRYS